MRIAIPPLPPAIKVDGARGVRQYGRVRALRLAFAWIAIALAVVPAVLAGAPAYAASAVLTPSPDHGGPQDPVTVVYQFQPDSDRCSRFTVEFFWDNQPIGRKRIDSHTCSVEVELTPPPSASEPGQHELGARGVRSDTQAVVAYTIDGGTPAPSSAPDDTTLPQAGAPNNGPPITPAATSSGGTPGWVWAGIIVGILLVLGGAAFLVMLVLRMHDDEDEGVAGLHRGSWWPPGR